MAIEKKNNFVAPVSSAPTVCPQTGGNIKVLITVSTSLLHPPMLLEDLLYCNLWMRRYFIWQMGGPFWSAPIHSQVQWRIAGYLLIAFLILCISQEVVDELLRRLPEEAHEEAIGDSDAGKLLSISWSF